MIAPVSANDRLIVALDMPTVDEARRLVTQLDGVVAFFKIGMVLQLSGGLDLARELIASGKKVFLDLKFYDIQETVRNAIRQTAEMGATFATVHGTSKIMRAAVEGRGDRPLKVFAVTVLTSLDQADVEELGFDCTVPDLVLARARKALEVGCDGVIASGQEAERIRGVTGGRLLIVTPGIRPDGTTEDDQKRATAPAQAIRAGADYLVVGRPIYNAPDPRRAAQAIVDEIARELARR